MDTTSFKKKKNQRPKLTEVGQKHYRGSKHSTLNSPHHKGIEEFSHAGRSLREGFEVFPAF